VCHDPGPRGDILHTAAKVGLEKVANGLREIQIDSRCLLLVMCH